MGQAQSIILVGGGGHCVSCIDVIESAGVFKIAGIVLECREGTKPLDYPFLGTDADLLQLLTTYLNALVTVGQIKWADVRRRLYSQLLASGATLPAVSSPHARVSSRAHIGQGTVVMHGAIVNAHSHVGSNCIINSQALIEHGTQVGDHCHISTGARINGDVVVGDGCFVGSGAIIKQGISIGDNAVIEAGEVVLADVPNGAWLRSAHGR